MGIENNECVIATTWDDEAVEDVKKWISKLDREWQYLFAVIPSMVNNKLTIVLGPDGSKKGWDLADKGQKMRDKFIKKLESFNYDDGSNPFDFVEVGYGEFGQKILRGNNVNRYSDEEYYGEYGG